MARVRRIVVSQVEGDYSYDSDKRPNGEISLYEDGNGGFDLVIHDGVNSTSLNKVLGKGKLYGNGSIKLYPDLTLPSEWLISSTNLTFPDSTVQNTAWSGGRVVANPASSIGTPSDLSGDISFSSDYLYYCTQNYDGITNIWKRINWSNDTWGSPF